MTLTITKISVISISGTDKIYMETNLPDGCYPYKDNATVMMEVAAGTGKEYVIRHFGIEPEVIIRNILSFPYSEIIK